MKTKKQKSLPKLKKTCWDWFSKYIRLRDALKTTGDVFYVRCVTCNKEKPTVEAQAGHFISRMKTCLLFDESNVHAQCGYCNGPMAGEQYKHGRAIEEMYGVEELDRLTKLGEKNPLKKFTRSELDDMKTKYKALVKGITKQFGSPWKQL